MTNKSFIRIFLLSSLLCVSACSEDSSDPKCEDDKCQEQPSCNESETKCETDEAGNSSLFTCTSNEWKKSDDECKACSQDKKSCVDDVTICSIKIGDQTQTLNDGEKACDANHDVVKCDAGTITVIEDCQPDAETDKTACSAEFKCETVTDHNQNDDPAKGCNEGWGGSQCDCDLAKNYVSADACMPLSCIDPTKDCTGTGVKTWKCSETDGTRDSTCAIEACNDGLNLAGDKCIDPNADDNHNHMFDSFETAPKQGESCRRYADCDSSEGAKDGFCDSLIGYKCSTKCSSDDQCLSGYVCRADGRCAPPAFVTEWKVTKPNDGFRFSGSGFASNDFTIDWGDGSDPQTVKGLSNNFQHRYKEAKTYTITITGRLDGWSGMPFYGASLLRVVSFGPVGLGAGAFSNHDEAVVFPADEIPDSSKLTTMNGMFRRSEKINQPVGNWDVSNVTDMNSAFSGAHEFNQPLNNWDVSQVTDMRLMFSQAMAFNQPINDWDVSKVTDMSDMFWGTLAFNQPLDKWKTQSLTKMAMIFLEAEAFNGDIDTWDVSKVTTMSNAFNGAKSFNKSLNSWDTSKVTDMENLFEGASKFDQNLDKWKVSQAKYIQYVFSKTALSQENYCQMIKADWKNKKSAMGISYTCP